MTWAAGERPAYIANVNSPDSYWGDPNRWKFKASIDNFATTVNVENGADRAAKSTFNIKLNGYLIPDVVNKDLAAARSKFYTKSQVVFDLEVIDSAGETVAIDKMRFANKAPAPNSLAATSFIGGGINVTNVTGVSQEELDYVAAQVLKTANTITLPNTVTFTNVTLLEPPLDSTFPPTSAANFTFFVNGVNVASNLVSIAQVGADVVATFNTAGMGYTLVSTDEVIAVGKFQ